jgi:prepilin-type N-terminal cleavage/methylation domain-containing protein
MKINLPLFRSKNKWQMVNDRWQVQCAFTLVELMIVVALIAVLATIAIMSLQGQISKGYDARRKSDINRLKIAVEEYEKDHNCYPQYVVCNDGGQTALQPYLNIIPCDPVTNTSYYYDNDGSSCPNWYRFYAKLQTSDDPQITPNIGLGGQYNFYQGSPNAPVPSESSFSSSSSSSSGGGGTSSTPTPTSAGTPSGFISGTITEYWGCFNGSCLPIKLNSSGYPVCSPSYNTNECVNTKNCDHDHECQ